MTGETTARQCLPDDLLSRLLTEAVADPATDPRVRQWLERLLAGEGSTGPQAVGEVAPQPQPPDRQQSCPTDSPPCAKGGVA